MWGSLVSMVHGEGKKDGGLQLPLFNVALNLVQG